MPKPARRPAHEQRVFYYALLGGLPAVVSTLWLLWMHAYEPKEQWTLGLVVVLCWLGFALAVREHVVRPLQTMANLLTALREGDFSTRDVFGTIDGDKVKLRSIDRPPGDQIVFTFAGTVSGDSISGPVYMGEYLNAKFTAKRHAYPAQWSSIVIPGGPPLAN